MPRRKIIAAIDVGSHDIQLKIAELGKGQPPQVIETVRRTLALGTDTYKSGRISQSLTDACSQVLAGFAEKLREYSVSDCRVVATSAFREADNRSQVVDQIERHSGLTIDILSNSEERYYHILAAAESLPDFDRMARQGTLFLDIGAGSIQASVFNEGELVFTQNMLLGSLRVRELLADLERQTQDFTSLMEEYVSGDLDNYQMLEPKGTTYRHLVILGGETGYLRKLAGVPVEGYIAFEDRQFAALYEKLLKTSPLSLALDDLIPSDHAGLLLPTAMIMRKFINFVGVSGFHLPAVDLCDGLLYTMAAQKSDYLFIHDPVSHTLSSCRHLARRFETDYVHSQYVEKLTLQLFDQSVRLHRLKSRDRLLLQIASILHDIGKYISMSKHAEQSYDMIMASEIIGLNLREQEVAAAISLGHDLRYGSHERSETHLLDEDRLRITKMSSLLLLADALDTGHRQKITSLEAWVNDDQFMIEIETDKDVTLESWSLEQKSNAFERVYGLKPVLRVRRPKP